MAVCLHEIWITKKKGTYVSKKLLISGPFNVTARSIPFPFISRSLSVQNPFIFLSNSVRSLYTFSVLFESISYSLHVRDQLLHVAVYDFYSLFKSMHAGQQFTCGRKNDSNSLTALIRIVLALASHASLNHTHCLRAFCSCSFDSVVVLFASIDYTCRWIGASTYICS